MTNDRLQLAEYQSRLLSVLHTAKSPEDALDAMHQIAVEAGLHNDAQAAELRMVDVAMCLTKKWGLKAQ